MFRYIFTGLLLLSQLTYAQQKLEYTKGKELVQAGIEAYDNEEYEEALEYYSKVHPGDSVYAWAVYETALTYSTMKDYQQAVEWCKRGLQLDDSYHYPSLHNLLASCYDDKGQPEDALAEYTRAIVRYPKSHQLYFNRGITHLRQKNSEAALEDLNMALRLNPSHSSTHYYMARIALSQKRFVEACQAALIFFSLEPTGSRANYLLVQLNDAAKKSETELENSEMQWDFLEQQSSTNKLFTSYVALSDKYDAPGDFGDFDLIKQVHLSLSSAKKAKLPKGNVWADLYIPMAEKLFKADQFEGFSYIMLASSGSEMHQRTIGSNKGAIEEYFEWFNEAMNEYRRFPNILGQELPAGERRFYHDDGSFMAIAPYNPKTMDANGPIVVYTDKGAISLSGSFNQEGKREGHWIWYYSDSTVKEVIDYKNGLRNGLNVQYTEKGQKILEATYVDDNLDGITKVYDDEGYLHRQMHHAAGSIEDSLVYYYPDGKRRIRLEMSEGYVDGKKVYYNILGEQTGFVEVKKDVENGAYEYYFQNGQLSVKATYVDGLYDGDYISYYENGQLESKGTFVEGKKSGQWTSYYYNGQIKEEEVYDDKGKRTGLYTEYNFEGQKVLELEYKKNDLIAYRNFGVDGQLLKSDKRKRGKFFFVNQTVYGTTEVEGTYAEDHKEGEWKYYYPSGQVRRIERFDEDGLLQGEALEYFTNGELKSRSQYLDGDLQGYFVNFYANGALASHGWYEAGKLEGVYEEYTPDSALTRRNYYNAGLLNGPYYSYDNLGRLFEIEHYAYGRVLEMMSFGPDSNLLQTNILKDGSGTLVHKFDGTQVYNQKTLVCSNSYGPSLAYYGSGELFFQGNLINNNFVGEAKWYYPNGQVELEGSYNIYEITGEWKRYFENGKLKESYTYENGLLHGPNLTYDEAGRLSDSLHYYQGQIHGARHFFTEGQLDHVRYYRLGQFVGYSYLNAEGQLVDMIPIPTSGAIEVVSYYQNGQESRRYNLLNGEFHGEYVQYYPDGSLQYRANYVHDEREGEVVNYYPNGNLKNKTTYVLGVEHGMAYEYHENGQLKSEKPYVYDDLLGTGREFDQSGKPIRSQEYRRDRLYSNVKI